MMATADLDEQRQEEVGGASGEAGNTTGTLPGDIPAVGSHIDNLLDPGYTPAEFSGPARAFLPMTAGPGRIDPKIGLTASPLL